MGKAERIRRMNAREKIAAQQAAAQRAEARRRLFLASGSVLAVLVIVVVLIVVKSSGNTPPASASGHTASAATTAEVVSEIATVPASTLDSVGAGSGVSPLTATKGQPSLTSDGKPEILYMGAEYCPYCAAERWALAVALSRFGTFSNLRLIHSDSNDVYSNTATLSFYKSTYTSQYVVFTPVELYGLKNNGVTLQKPTAAQAALIAKYDPPTSQSSGSPFPFVDFGNQYLATGAQYLPSALGSTASVNPGHYGLTWTQIAASLKNPASPVAKAIDGTANSITAAICKITKNAPAAVCNSTAATAGAGSL